VKPETFAAIAAAVAAIGRDSLPEKLVKAAGTVISYNAAAFLMFHAGSPPTVLVDQLQAGERGHLYGDYLSGVYLLSPFFRLAQQVREVSVARVRDIAPQGFAHSEYHRRYFAPIGVGDLLGLLLPMPDGDTAFLSFSRGRGGRRFSLADVRALQSIAGVLATILQRHLELHTMSGIPRNTRHLSPPGDHDGLTARESQIVNLLLEGHSTRGTAQALHISHETVRVHRRNIYRKLGVTSQAGLFRWFLSSRG
jgi:DNA-binding CsgD family transcriptional regulator